MLSDKKSVDMIMLYFSYCIMGLTPTFILLRYIHLRWKTDKEMCRKCVCVSIVEIREILVQTCVGHDTIVACRGTQ